MGGSLEQIFTSVETTVEDIIQGLEKSHGMLKNILIVINIVRKTYEEEGRTVNESLRLRLLNRSILADKQKDFALAILLRDTIKGFDSLSKNLYEMSENFTEATEELRSIYE